MECFELKYNNGRVLVASDDFSCFDEATGTIHLKSGRQLEVSGTGPMNWEYVCSVIKGAKSEKEESESEEGPKEGDETEKAVMERTRS